MMLKLVYPNCAGLDVHKKFVVACRLTVDGRGDTHPESRTFTTMTDDLRALAAWLAEGQVTHVAMESTGVYWQPIYNILEDHFELFLVNAQSIKRMPGRKTDMKGQWKQLVVITLTLALAAAGCKPPDLAGIVRQDSEAINKGDMASVMSRYTEDAVLVLQPYCPPEVPCHGKPTIQHVYEQMTVGGARSTMSTT